MIEWLGYLSAILIGLSLGLIGGGGSILTIPALVYLLGVNPVLATAYSLFIVGATSLAGSVSYIRRGLLNYKIALYFAIPSLLIILFMRSFVVPAIPDQVLNINNFTVSKDLLVMVFFALTMIFSSCSMIRAAKEPLVENDAARKYSLIKLLFPGIVVGVITGLIGAGGGFLIIPSLVVFAKLPMKTAIGTSLFIIAINSLFGFIGDVLHRTIDWQFLVIFTSIAIGGIIMGTALTTSISARKLKTFFGWFVLAMGVFILIEELFKYM